MKLLVNGNTVSEIVKGKLNTKYSDRDFNLVEKMIDHIKTNKVMYAKLVFIIALMLHFDINVFASSFETSLDKVGNQIVDMLLSIAKWGCIGMGIKNMIGTMLNGGNMKQASTEGIQYFLGYLFIQFFPQLFDLFKGIKF